MLILTFARISPTTKLLSFCLCDAGRDDPGAQVLHDALRRIADAQVMWKNEASDVWSFIGNKGLGADIDREVEDERALLPSTAPATLLRNTPEVQEELGDRLGDFGLDPAETGVVRRVSVTLLQMAKGDTAVEEINPARENSSEYWRSANGE